MISKSVFLQGIKKLELNFGVEVSEERFNFLHSRLTDSFTDTSFTTAVEAILNGERFFPVISVFQTYNPKREFVL